MSVELIRTRHGWTHPKPGPCACGESAAWVSFQFCRCAGAEGGGHISWRCRACDQVRMLGCAGKVEVPNEYGGRFEYYQHTKAGEFEHYGERIATFIEETG